MNDKGRLEHIKLQNQLFIKHEKAEEHQRADEYLLGLWQEHGSWIIEQLERVQELEKNIRHYKEAIKSWEVIESYSREQNKRYRESIKKSIALFGYDESQEGMKVLSETLEKSK